jgi:hypothetical protein
MGDAYVLYAVVSKDGKLRRTNGRNLKVYEALAPAQRSCRHPGDSVVEVIVSLDRAPLFIRGNKLGE